jgi:integrase
VVRLKVKHIDSAQRIIRIEQSKGRKGRNVMLSPETLDLLRQWWRRGDRVGCKFCCTAYVCSWQILLQKSFCTRDQNFF